VHGQLGGRAEKQWPPGGLRCEVTIAADRLAEPDEAPTAALNGAKARPATAGSLQQLAILVVEDEPVVALELAGTLQSLGCEVVGPAGTLEQALRLGASEAGRLAAAVVDVNLHGRSAFPVAELLGDRGVPVVWASGYGELPPGFVGRTAFELVRKPVTKGQIAAALRRAIAAVAQARSGVDDGSTIGDGGTSCGPGSEFGSRTGAGTSCGGGSDGGATGG
jgi:CheY-like chemotaxis protein